MARVRQNAGAIIGFILIGLFIVNMVELHNASRSCAAQMEPGTHHDWAAVLEAL